VEIVPPPVAQAGGAVVEQPPRVRGVVLQPAAVGQEDVVEVAGLLGPLALALRVGALAAGDVALAAQALLVPQADEYAGHGQGGRGADAEQGGGPRPPPAPAPRSPEQAHRAGADWLGGEEAAQVIGQRRGAGVALARLLLQALQADGDKVAG